MVAQFARQVERRGIRVVLLAGRTAPTRDVAAFYGRYYRGSGVLLAADPSGAVARRLGITGHPQYVWLDARARPATAVTGSLVEGLAGMSAALR